MAVVAPSEAEIRARLRDDTPYYAENCLKIIDTAGRIVPLRPKPAQLDFDSKLEAQRLEGKPMRAIVLKSRKLGFSTWTQGKITQRTTQRPNHVALVVAQDNETAGGLHEIGQTMYAHLPDELDLKPPIANQRRARWVKFGTKSREARARGDLGLNSSLGVDTANELEASRGLTIHSLHASECAFWADLKRKLTSLQNAVPDDPGTLIVLESTANGHNHFKTLWDQAENGESDYAACFFAWFQEPDYQRPFLSDEERADFEADVGRGEWGEDEPQLIEEFGLTLEQLNWRRWAIANRCQSDLRTFHQEYPSRPEEAFLSTGRQVFSTAFVSRAIAACRTSDLEADKGLLRPTKTVKRATRRGTAEVAVGALWVPREATGHSERHPFWKRWEEPVQADKKKKRPAGQYIVAVDPAAGDESDSEDDAAYHAIEVIDHRTGRQVAEYRSRLDPDLVAEEALLAALYYNKAWLVIERTGGWGLSMLHVAVFIYRYPRVYTSKSQEKRHERWQDRLGWDTSRASKRLLEDGGRTLLRENYGPESKPEHHNLIRSLTLAREHATYVRNDKGQTVPEPGKHADCLMAWLIGQQVALEKPVRPDGGRGTTSTSTRGVVNERTGY